MNSIERYDNIICAYQYEYSERDNSNHGDIEYYIDKLKNRKGRVLELGCGTGRITLSLKKAGVDVLGLDQATAMLEIARKKVSGENLDIDFKLSDAVTFTIDEKFSDIIFPYNSICFIDNDKLNLLALNIKKHLEPFGRFFFDLSKTIKNSYYKSGRRSLDWSPEIFIKELNLYLQRRIEIINFPEKKIIEYTYFWKIRYLDGKIEEFSTTMEMSSYIPEEYVDIFEVNGFSLVEMQNKEFEQNNIKRIHSFCELILK